MRIPFEGTARDAMGNVVALATCSTFLSGTGTTATIYATSVSVPPLTSVTADNDGSFIFFIDPSSYSDNQLIDITISKVGYISKTFTWPMPLQYTSTPSFNNITFPIAQAASSNVHTLDDYREGTFQLGLTFGGSATGITYLTNGGLYTKVGNLVNIMGDLAILSKGAQTGVANITGLPYPAKASGYSAISLYVSLISFTGHISGYVDPGESVIHLCTTTDAGVASFLTDANFTNSCVIKFSLTYLT